MNFHIPKRLAIPIVLLVAAGFSTRSRADDLSDNLAKWQSMRPAHYQYKRTKYCYCPYKTFLVEAEGETVTKAEFTSVTTDFSPEPLQSLSIDSLFGQIKRYQAANPFKLEVTYDSGFGFPAAVSVDYRENTADDESGILVFEFKVLTPAALFSPKAGRSIGASKGIAAGLYRKDGGTYAPDGRSAREFKPRF